MPQSSVIFGYLFVGFLLFVSAKGELATYVGYLTSSAPAPAANPTATGSTTSSPTAQQNQQSSGIDPTLSTAYSAVTGVAGVAALLA